MAGLKWRRTAGGSLIDGILPDSQEPPTGFKKEERL